MARAARIVKDPHQKKVIRLFMSLVGRFNLWRLWSDFIVMTALEISIAVDEVNAAEREKEYLRLKDQYTEAERKVFAEILAEIIEGMMENSDQDFLGELFMGLDLGNDAGGQFFTPYHLCQMMARLNRVDIVVETIRKYGWASVNDCACGAGATLIAFANECRRQGINYQETILFVAQDIDYITGLMCYVQLSLLGCAGYVYIGDTMSDPCTCLDGRGLIPKKREKVWIMPMYISYAWTTRVLKFSVRGAK